MAENNYTKCTCIQKTNIDKNNNNISQLSKPTLDRQQPKALHFKLIAKFEGVKALQEMSEMFGDLCQKK